MSVRKAVHCIRGVCVLVLIRLKRTPDHWLTCTFLMMGFHFCSHWMSAAHAAPVQPNLCQPYSCNVSIFGSCIEVPDQHVDVLDDVLDEDDDPD